jgi:geranylgeranyl pyrophosphate synthase
MRRGTRVALPTCMDLTPHPLRTDNVIPIEPPTRYQGFFARSCTRYLPLLEEAKATLRAHPVPAVIRDAWLQVVDARAQPGFIFFPLMFLDLAERTGGITPRHRAYLPWVMLTMELIALYDDTIDFTPTRSGEPTYTARHGAAAAAVLAGFVQSTVAERTAAILPELSPSVTRIFGRLCAHELWEHDARYPATDDETLSRWIRTRYEAIPAVIAYTLDGALGVQGLGPIPWASHLVFAGLMQDVDDLVNIVEEREKEGENDDLKLGIPSIALVATLRAEPEARALLETLWAGCRGVAARTSDELAAALLAVGGRTEEAHRALVALVRRHGVAPTVESVITDAEEVVALAPPHACAALREYAFSVVDRLRDVDPRARLEAHAVPFAVYSGGAASEVLGADAAAVA